MAGGSRGQGVLPPPTETKQELNDTESIQVVPSDVYYKHNGRTLFLNNTVIDNTSVLPLSRDKKSIC